MPRFAVGRPIATEEPTVVVEPGLTVGRHLFTLVVVDDEGHRSEPARVIVEVRPA